MMLWLLAAALAADVITTEADAITIDGVVDEAAWERAVPVDHFLRYQPVQGEEPQGTTEVRFLQDAETLYVGIRVRDTPQPVRARLGEREAINADDQIGLYLDPFGDAQAGYIFYLNALGIQQDLQFTAGQWNVNWNAVLRSKGTVTEDGRGYDLEVALPFRSIKYPSDARSQDWGLILTRKIPGEGAKYGWPRLVQGYPRLFTQAGKLRGVRPPKAGSGIELIPGVTGRVESTRPDTASTPTWSDFDPWFDVIRPFVDVRVGVSPNLALVGAINPDFSEVEEDISPVVLNNRFAFRFRERRPFFTEGDGFFTDRHETLYSRSIVQPLYGVKLAGREGPWSIGLLHAVDRSPEPTINENGTPGFDDVDGRWAVDSLIRIRRDLPGAGFFGITFADKHMVNEGFTPNRDSLGDYAGHDMLGLDLVVPLPDRWQLDAGHAQSWTASDTARLGGSLSSVRIRRPPGRGFGGSLGGSFVSKDFRQELGFRPQTGLGRANAEANWTIPGKGRVSAITPSIGGRLLQEIDGQYFREVNVRNRTLIDGIHGFTVGGGVNDRRETDGRREGRVTGWFVNGSYNGQIGAAAELRPSIRYGREMDFRDLTAAFRLNAGLDATLRPARPLRIDLITRYIRLDRTVPPPPPPPLGAPPPPPPEAGGPPPPLPDLSHDLLVRMKMNWQLHRDWGIRVIVAYNLITDQPTTLQSSLLLRWLPHPFTALYLGYAERTDVGTAPGTLDRSIFAKVHVLLRPDRWGRKRGSALPSGALLEPLDAIPPLRPPDQRPPPPGVQRNDRRGR
jgi:hypothetical protein